MTDVPVNPDVLIWAREERGMTGEQAAEALGVPVEQLARYEAGDDRPSVSFLRQMEGLQDRFRQPFNARPSAA